MPICHKFKSYNWENGFYTKDSILHTPYKPEVMFIGTFNHGWSWNKADFFYGRDMYMWPILANLFIYNNNYLNKPRNEKNSNPTLEEIFKICLKGKITFSDIVKGTKNEVNTIVNDNNIIVNSTFKWNNYSDKQLKELGKNEMLDDNVNEIIKYIKANKSLKHIYFTFKSETWLLKKRDEIISNIGNINSGSIFTPTGMGFRKNIFGFNNRCSSLSHCWIWNGELNKIHKKGYIHLDHDWLRRKGVSIMNF